MRPVMRRSPFGDELDPSGGDAFSKMPVLPQGQDPYAAGAPFHAGDPKANPTPMPLAPEQIENDQRRRASEAAGFGWGGRRPGQPYNGSSWGTDMGIAGGGIAGGMARGGLSMLNGMQPAPMNPEVLQRKALLQLMMKGGA